MKLYSLGSKVAFAKDDSDVVERSRQLFKGFFILFNSFVVVVVVVNTYYLVKLHFDILLTVDAAPFFMKDDLCIFSRSLVSFMYEM